MKKNLILLFLICFPTYLYADTGYEGYTDISHEGDGVILQHTEEKNVPLPDDLKNMNPTTQEEDINSLY